MSQHSLVYTRLQDAIVVNILHGLLSFTATEFGLVVLLRLIAGLVYGNLELYTVFIKEWYSFNCL